MKRILLADDSPHAQRMGERILREEGYEVVSVTDGATALVRLTDVEPDLVIADAALPGQSGFDICRHIKGNPRYRYTRVVLTAGALEPLDEAEARLAGSDAILRKPFEASVMTETVGTLIEASRFARELLEREGEGVARPETAGNERAMAAAAPAVVAPVRESVPAAFEENAVDSVPEAEMVRAAVTLALDAAFPALVDEITRRVVESMKPQERDYARKQL